MILIRFIFMLCLFCFAAKQSGLIVKTSGKSKITHESIDDDCEEKEGESEEDELEKLFELNRSEEAVTMTLLKSKLVFPALYFFYKEHLNFPVSPPPDSV
ncbi:MAG: hypothetical protein QMB24_12445 [Spirosomataceae bacterium]